MDNTYTLDDIYKAQDAAFNQTPTVPTYKTGKSIVTSFCQKDIPSAYVLFSELRRLHINLPIEIFYRKDELDPQEIDEFRRTFNGMLNFYQIQGNSRDFIDQWGNKKGWSTKVYAIIESGYAENLWLDVDNVPIQNCLFLFDDIEYKNKGSLFWRDVYSVDRAETYSKSSKLWDIFRVPWNDAEPFESGQFLVNKLMVWQELYMMLHFADNCEIYFQFGGDAECWKFAWQHCAVRKQKYHSHTNYNSSDQVPYGFMPYGPFHKGVPNQWHKYGGGTVMVQRDRKGHELFNHRNLNKWAWTDNVFNEDVLNEPHYHMIIKHMQTKYGFEKNDA
jgi:Mannosyltransferase putative